MIKNRVDIITLGCSKNLVDSEILMHQLEECGYVCTHDDDNPQGEIAVINTCGFIGDAKEESIVTILQFAQAKSEGRLSQLYVMGCLSARFKEELQQEIPEVDKYYGKFDFKQLLVDLKKRKEASNSFSRHLTTPSHYAYLKISEGCDRHCAYCAIPLSTGHHKSRSQQEILQEVHELVGAGVKEFQVIAQELTYYGRDLDGKSHIAELITAITQVPGVEWVRLHYAYPNNFPYELLDVIASNSKVCKYLDIALQHISDHILSRMLRHVTKDETIAFVNEIRRRVPGITLRTTLMVGFPGETDEDFKELEQFVRDMRFERMGAFPYSEEEGTYSALHYSDDIPAELKQQRLDRIMKVQEQISAEILSQKIGTQMRVIIDRREGNYFVARGEDSSPEVDPEVLIPISYALRIGEFITVRIVNSEEFDLYAEPVE